MNHELSAAWPMKSYIIINRLRGEFRAADFF